MERGQSCPNLAKKPDVGLIWQIKFVFVLSYIKSNMLYLCLDYYVCIYFDIIIQKLWLVFSKKEVWSQCLNKACVCEQRLTDRYVSKPMVAAVSGYAVGVGMDIALWCDMRVMEDTAILGCFQRRFGKVSSLFRKKIVPDDFYFTWNMCYRMCLIFYVSLKLLKT